MRQLEKFTVATIYCFDPEVLVHSLAVEPPNAINVPWLVGTHV